MATYVTGRMVQDETIDTNDLQLGARIPPGAVMSFAMSAAPVGWLPCDGSAISRTTYASLFAAVRTIHGAGDGSNTFNVPDLRGEFIRGWDNGRAIDSGRTFGTSQVAYAGQNTFYMYRDDGDSQTGSRGEVTAFSVNSTAVMPQNSPNGTGYTQTVPTTPGDTRPRNIALLYCIKF